MFRVKVIIMFRDKVREKLSLRNKFRDKVWEKLGIRLGIR